MNLIKFLNRRTSWTNAELGLIKICVGSAYLIIGSYFHEFFHAFLVVAGIVFVITAGWTFYLWIKKW